MKNKTKEIVFTIIAFLGSLAGCYAIIMISGLMMQLSLVPRMICFICSYWLAALIPLIVMLLSKDKLTDYGFRKQKIGSQLISGLLIGAGMSLVLTVIPHLAGFGAYVNNGRNYAYLWQFAYEFIYCTVGVALTEEFVFRGVIYEKIRRIGKSDVTAVIVSSVLFGLFHIFTGNLIQLIITACIGAFFCICRLKIKSCSTLSLIVAHGVYDALITVWAFALH